MNRINQVLTNGATSRLCSGYDRPVYESVCNVGMQELCLKLKKESGHFQAVYARIKLTRLQFLALGVAHRSSDGIE
jgi:hypothetical protein